MVILTIFLSFILCIACISFGMAVGYALGYKNDKTLKQQISTLKSKLKTSNESAQLKELTITELQARDNWDFKSRLAEITNVPVTTITPNEDDPQSMENTF